MGLYVLNTYNKIERNMCTNILNVRAFNLYTPLNHTEFNFPFVTVVYNEKKRLYKQWIKEIELASFANLMVSSICELSQMTFMVYKSHRPPPDLKPFDYYDCLYLFHISIEGDLKVSLHHLFVKLIPYFKSLMRQSHS